MTALISGNRRAWGMLLLGVCLTAFALGAAATARADDGSAEYAPTVQVRDGGALGMILAGGNGMTLYVFDRDTPGVSNCNGGCAMAWPPLMLDEGDPIAPPDLPGALGVITRADGGRQVTYNDRPLYYYEADSQPGDVKGDGVGGVWHVVAP